MLIFTHFECSGTPGKAIRTTLKAFSGTRATVPSRRHRDGRVMILRVSALSDCAEGSAHTYICADAAGVCGGMVAPAAAEHV